MQLTGPGHWGEPADPENAVAILRRAVELGVNHFDTADAYGPGVAEEIIRKALHPYREELVIATKGGLTRQGPNRWAPVGPAALSAAMPRDEPASTRRGRNRPVLPASCRY
ncbi:aldo/keto reductase [Nocardia sp. MW-W600-9]